MAGHATNDLPASRHPTLLATCRAFIMHANRSPYVVRILIDQGSELSFVSEGVINSLKIPRHAASVPLAGIGGVSAGRTRGAAFIRLQSIHDKDAVCQIKAFILPRLTARIPSFDLEHQSWPHLQNLQLADPKFSRSGRVDLILGADYYGAVIRDGLIKGSEQEPIAQYTIFGWILSGPVKTDSTIDYATEYHCSVDETLQDLLTRFWHQEEPPSLSASTLSPSEEECERHFLSTHTRDPTGRYIVRLPFRSPPDRLGRSKTRALRMLGRLEKRLSTDSNLRQRYEDFLEEYRELGHMVEASTEERDALQYYLPHHGVLREDRSTTKLRVVFNASSRTENGVSLNDLLHSGPKLQTDITDVLLWIRSHRFIFSTDVVKMFRQIAVHPDDWKYQSILWRGAENTPSAFFLTTVTYGLTCAPYLALRCIQQFIRDEGAKFPKAVLPLTKGRYVDDIFGGADTVSEAKETARQVEDLCKAGGFPLQKWKSNSSDICPSDLADGSDNEKDVEFERSLVKILGIVWKPNGDFFHFIAQPPLTRNLSKRTILSDIARLFDPLGLLSPVTVRAKMLLQDLWLIKVDWDEALPEATQRRWTAFRDEFQALRLLSIPKCLGIGVTTRVEIHGFSDASNLAMAAAVYVRTVSTNEDITVRLAYARMRVAPLKRLTIPRLELCAALLLTRLVQHTIHTLDLKEAPIFLWTDSSVTLTWITTHPSRWKDYVRNRVTTIQDLLPTASWSFIPGKENPADCASRGMRTEQFINHSLWWSGPPWLSGPEDAWPTGHAPPLTDVNLEERPGYVLTTTATPLPYWNLLDRYSSLNRLLRVTATCRRFVSRLRRLQGSLQSEPLTPEELQWSRHFWCKVTQRAWYRTELRHLSKGEALARSNPLVKLTPFIDQEGVMRVGGRLHYANLDIETKHPIILPNKSPLSTLVIADAHQRTLHGGTQVTLGFLRRTYWIIGGRTPVRSYILRCVTCARFRGQRAQQLMGQLPTHRVAPSKPFLNSGIDYAGPITLKMWSGKFPKFYKGYLAIFICMATSAVHIEIATDYTTEAFLAAYKRFTGRRGICATLRSDCGTNFVGADAALRQLFADTSQELRELASLIANDGTKWIFNPPSSPHFGGKWEAAVKSTKFHLKRVLGDTAFTYEELSTIVVQIEAVLNSRPLCGLSDDADDLTALTPDHFLIGEATTTIPEPNLADVPLSRLSRWQLLRQKVELFWKRWSTECLQRYQMLSKWYHPTNEVKEGSLVLITDERSPPAKWPRGRVVKLHKGPNGLTRVVTLRTDETTYQRPIAKFCVRTGRY